MIQQAATLVTEGRLREAEQLYRAVIRIDHHNFDGLYQLGLVKSRHGELDEACQFMRQALRRRPDSALAHNSLGIALAGLGRCEAAIAHFEKSIALKPDHADAYANLGNVLVQVGRIDEAYPNFEKSVTHAPCNGMFMRNFVYARRITRGERRLEKLESLAREMAALPMFDQTALHFALSKAYADLDEPARSFDHLLRANALARQQTPYDEAATLTAFAMNREVFTPELMRAKSGVGDPSEAPIFIVGMPRTGTTLIEQMLASHPRVFGAGEIATFGLNLVGFQAAHPELPPLPLAFSSLSDDQIRIIGRRYLRSVRAAAPGAHRIVDKMPANFRFLGPIHLALPNARIIHARRDAIDTCLSCFSTQFTGYQPHTHDLAELGRYYVAYQTLMDHWRAVLPPGVMLEVQYEDLITDFEGQARRIAEHCGLAWNDACLRFHETQRVVQTASAIQVRRPIYRSSVGRWRPYAEKLGPLFQALGPYAGVAAT
ncbi:MAG: sulfotransferase [Alphaproteobacteria bacterium]|nr:sulfotransferase [Alphaproteobacteria bacterium]